jgi:hypothetical protein
MSITQILSSFAHDEQVKAVAILIAADLVLGIIAAINMGTFRLTYISNFLRNDVVGKVLPWFALFAFGKTSGAGVVGIDFGTIADSAFVLTSAALVGSLLSSLADLGISLPAGIAGHAPPSQRSAPAAPARPPR